MVYANFRIKDLIQHAILHEWSIPEFQRGFVWKPSQVRDLAESLWLDYPVGSILIWNSAGQRREVEPRYVEDVRSPTLWLVDGQQRTTALCILAGRKPYWWSDAQDWHEVIQRNDVRFDISAREPPYFVLASGAIRKVKSNRYIPVRQLLSIDLEKDSDQQKLAALAKEVKSDGLCDGMDSMEIKTRLERVCRIRNREIVGITVDHELEDVVEIFARLNSKGTRVRESDIYLGVVAARQPGWVRSHFMPYLDELEETGFEIGPNVLFQSLTAIGARRVRFKDIEDKFWNPSSIQAVWERTKQSWKLILSFLESRGILTNALMPSDAVFISLSALLDKFEDAPRGKTFYWLVQALRYGRYSGSSTSSLEEDLREIDRASSGGEAIQGMINRIRAIEPIVRDELMRDYSESRFGRLLLYLLAFERKARDWDTVGDRLAFRGRDLVRGYQPQFHHIFPRKFISGKAAPEQVEALANIAIIGAATNIRISNKNPLDYFDRYKIDATRRSEQFILGDVSGMTLENFPSWLEARSSKLAEEANALLSKALAS